MNILRLLWRGLRLAGRGLRLLLRWLRRLLVLLIFVVLIQRSTFPADTQFNVIAGLVSPHQFDYISWEVGALWNKISQTLWGVHPYMDEAARSQFVHDYMRDLTEARRLEAEVNAIYTDPAINDPQAASVDVRQLRDALRADLRQRQSLVESILEGQVAAVLVDEGFGVMGQLLPPIAMHFTQVPNLLIVSPRDEIRFDVSLNLDPLPVDEIAALEERIDAAFDVSSLIVPLGGIALFPAMILETTSIPWALETFAHEWVHHYFFFFPLGLNYFTGGDAFAGEARIINETVADVFGREIGARVLARYYPELAQPTSAPMDALAMINQHLQTQPAAFDFGAAMHETRTTVDKGMAEVSTLNDKSAVMEAAGRSARVAYFSAYAGRLLDDIEAYMEQRRQFFYDNGYRIRKLNQAYFAFYGGYQGGIPGIGGQDPIGPAVEAIRAMSPDVRQFIVTMRGITTRAELLEVRDRMAREQSAMLDDG